MNSDAYDHGIEIKFYVDKALRPYKKSMAILWDNGVEEQDILWLDGSRVEGLIPHNDGYFSYCAKKCALYTDTRLKNYDWVFQFDSDVFAMPNRNGERLLFFENFFKEFSPDCLVSALVSTKDGDPPYPTFDRLKRQVKDETSVKRCKARLKELVGDDIYDQFHNPDRWFMDCHGGFHAFPAKTFMRDRWSDCELLVNLASCLICDETTLSFWHTMGNPLLDMFEMHNCRIGLLHTINSKNLVTIMDLLRSNTPFLFHYADNVPESHWLERIGAYEE